MSVSDFRKSLILLAFLSCGLTALAYGFSLGVTFISEDWIHVLVAQHILSGDISLLLDSFTKPWLQTSRVGVFFRPLIDLSFLWDTAWRQFLYWGCGAAAGNSEFVQVFRLTNLFLHAMTSFFVGVITLVLTTKLSGKNAGLAAVIATALTATNPLSLETLLWIICRCDGLSTCLSMATLAFYLLSLTFPQKCKLCLTISFSSFFLALLSKETAFVLPLEIFLVWIIFYRDIKGGHRTCLLYLATLAIFIALRALAIGGLGGYQASMGELLDGGMLEHFANPQDWLRAAYPYNQAYYSSASFNYLPASHSLLYLALGAALMLAAGKKTLNPRMLIFAVVSFVLTLLPARQVFMILPTLFGARTLYLPECFLFVLFGYALAQATRPAFSRVWTALFVTLSIYTSYLNIAVFQDYSNILVRLKEEIIEFVEINPGKLLSIANLPFNYKVGSILGEVWQMRTACAGTRGDINNLRLVTAAVAYHPHPDLFNVARAVSQVNETGAALLCVLPGLKKDSDLVYVDKKIIDAWQAPLSIKFDGKRFTPMPTRILNLNLGQTAETVNFQGADFAEVLVRKKGPASKEVEEKEIESVPRFYPLPDEKERITFLWHTDYGELIYPNTTLAAPLERASPLVRYRFALSDKFSFKCATQLKDLTVIGLPNDYELVNVTLKDGKSLIPTLEPRSLQKEQDLIYGAISTKGEPVEYFYDLTGIKDADRALVELTRPDGAFIHTTGTLLEAGPRKASVLSWQQEGVRGTVKIDNSKMPKKGRYQVRVMSINNEGKTIGYFSFPRDIIYNPEGFGPMDRPDVVDFNRMIFDTRPDKS